MIVSNAIEKMIDFYQGSQHDINHFLKVWSYARNIGQMEGLDDHTQEVLELTAVVHDISCPLCRNMGKPTEKNRNWRARHWSVNFSGIFQWWRKR